MTFKYSSFKSHALRSCMVLIPAFFIALQAPAAEDAKKEEAKPANKVVEPQDIVIPKSSFTADKSKGVDPFFPSSKRWAPPEPPKPVVPKVVKPSTPAPPPPPPDYYQGFELKGVTGTSSRKFALISTGAKIYTFGQGETRSVQTLKGVQRLTVEQISSFSVVVRLSDADKPKELKL